jgi:phosphopantothenoylcysteine decarboxylase/phosphopantothenate--cysteine ligase
MEITAAAERFATARRVQPPDVRYNGSMAEPQTRAVGRTVVVGVGGGIAAYKACDLVRRLRAEGASVRVALTPNATRFVSALTFQALSGEPVLADLMDASQEGTYGHLTLARAADLMVIAPATADLLAKLRVGMCDDAVTTVAVAARGPFLLCPAMNVAMWESPRVQENLAALRADARVQVCGPTSGLLADGDVGMGRMAEVADIVEAAIALLGPHDLAGHKVLITAGPTREPFDPVRFISNPSSGRMGFALAAAAARRGARVVLISGPVDLAPPAGVEVRQVTTAEEMLQACLAQMDGTDLVIGAAAVSDYRPVEVKSQKAKKNEGEDLQQVTLARTPDVLATLSARAREKKSRAPVLVGFAAETENLVANARKKLTGKRLDLVVANLVGKPGAGFGAERNEVVLLQEGREDEVVPSLTKLALAERILDRAVALLSKRTSS